MQIRGFTQERVTAIVAKVSEDHYGGNLRCNLSESRGDWLTLNLKVTSSRGTGAKRSASGRRTASACWHVHRDILTAMFLDVPTGRVKSVLADYRGLTDFLASFESTKRTKVGSQRKPISFGKLCDCTN